MSYIFARLLFAKIFIAKLYKLDFLNNKHKKPYFILKLVYNNIAKIFSIIISSDNLKKNLNQFFSVLLLIINLNYLGWLFLIVFSQIHLILKQLIYSNTI